MYHGVVAWSMVSVEAGSVALSDLRYQRYSGMGFLSAGV